MFDAEKLLGKVMKEVSKTSKKVSKHKKHKKGHKSDDFLSGMAGHLKSGKGIMTAIGLGVGVYEFMRHKNSGGQPGPPPPGHAPAPPPPGPEPSRATPPPPPPAGAVNQPGRMPSPPSPFEETPASPEAGQELALRLIRVMIAAAYADGHLDPQEEQEILARLRSVELSREEKQFILSEFHRPRSIEELTAGIGDPQIAQTMYSLAVSAVVIDTPEERAWLDRLAEALAISPEMKEFIEET